MIRFNVSARVFFFDLIINTVSNNFWYHISPQFSNTCDIKQDMFDLRKSGQLCESYF